MRGYSEVGSVTELHYYLTLAAKVKISSSRMKGGSRETNY